MTALDVTNLAIAIGSLLLSVALAGFALWQAREYARDANASTAETARLQRDIAVAVRSLETQSDLLSSVLGAQIDRLTTHVTHVTPSADRLLDIVRSVQSSASSPLPPAQTDHVDDDRIELIRTQVDAARLAGTLNIFLRGILKDLNELRATLDRPSYDSDVFASTFTDSHRIFTVYLDRIERHGERRLQAAGVVDLVDAFRKNYVPHVKPTL